MSGLGDGSLPGDADFDLDQQEAHPRDDGEGYKDPAVQDVESDVDERK